jgi:hypothetical protein
MTRRLLWLLASLALLPAAARAQNPPPTCPFTPAELQAALGVPVKEGVAQPEIDAGPMVMRSCRYAAKDWSLRVGTTVYRSADEAKAGAALGAGTKVPIPGDPDGAFFQEGQGDLTGPVVRYARGPIAVELRAMGTWYADARTKDASMRALRQTLATLRRIP